MLSWVCPTGFACTLHRTLIWYGLCDVSRLRIICSIRMIYAYAPISSHLYDLIGQEDYGVM